MGDSIVRLEDVAEVTLGAENYDLNVAFSGKRSVFIGIKVAPRANILTVAKNVRKAFPDLQSQLPTGVTGEIVYDSTEFINTSITEVVKTLVESLVIVTIVIFLFLGTSARRHHSRHRHAAVADRHLLRDAGVGILDQSIDAVGVGAGHRTRGR